MFSIIAFVSIPIIVILSISIVFRVVFFSLLIIVILTISMIYIIVSILCL